MTKGSKKGWSYSAGERGRNRVRAYEDAARGTIFLEFYETVAGTVPGMVPPKRVRLATRSRDREAAKRKADELAARFSSPNKPRVREATLESLFDIYLRE